jgi:hypothetical protein
VLQNAISKSPIVFLKLAEDQVGEYDLLMVPEVTASSQTFWLNSTDIDDNIKLNAPDVQGSVPRWVILARIASVKEPTRNVSSAILAIHSLREKEIQLGRGWTHPPLGKDEAHITRSVLSTIGVTANAGETVNIQLDIMGALSVSNPTTSIFTGG